MKVVVQRSKYSKVEVDNKLINEIDKGLVLLVSFTHGDTLENIDTMAKKIANLRIFDDENGVMNKSILDVGGSILSISQFTLYGSVVHGNRPSFTEALSFDKANEYYDIFIKELKKSGIPVENGIFGADMKIELLNDGPVTILIDSEELV